MIGEMLQKWIEKESRDFGYGELQIVLTYHDGKLNFIDKTKRERVRFKEGRLQFAK